MSRFANHWLVALPNSKNRPRQPPKEWSRQGEDDVPDHDGLVGLPVVRVLVDYLLLGQQRSFPFHQLQHDLIPSNHRLLSVESRFHSSREAPAVVDGAKEVRFAARGEEGRVDVVVVQSVGRRAVDESGSRLG